MKTGNILMCIVVVAFIFYMLTNSKQIGLEGAGCACGKKCTCGKEAFFEALEANASDSDSFSEGANDTDEDFSEGITTTEDDSFSEGSDSDFA